MMKLLACVAAFTLISGAAAADDLRLSTDVAAFAKPIKEAECLDKAKSAIAAQKFEVSDAAHAKAGKRANMVVMVDCLQSWKSNAAHISVAYLSADPKEATAVVAAIKKALEAK